MAYSPQISRIFLQGRFQYFDEDAVYILKEWSDRLDGRDKLTFIGRCIDWCIQRGGEDASPVVTSAMTEWMEDETSLEENLKHNDGQQPGLSMTPPSNQVVS